MAVTIEIYPDYAELYGIDVSWLQLPEVGESARGYIKRARLGKEEDVLLVVNGASQSASYLFQDGDAVKIYPLAASG